ncbi:50S ribosomal protein L11 methyltransferase [Nitratireductor indicus]|uniref:50S ribosomal protein L11 methyltransferase n=1 Tax=Nitratireductor indicus TaxID=721133 RepID=UPI002875FE45|nr:50S ribosomal protein L11 methyltransferase [Nitratireductor indicus]MDS1135705.1 50S ribosomal protein L11 methyltransferase [Nitratireductor indicus]
MAQTRIYMNASKSEADALFKLLDARFEEDGLPISVFEADEENGRFEVSLYAEEEDADRVFNEVGEAVATLPDPPQLLREVLPEIDWVAHSLEGLKPVRVGRFLIHGSHDRNLRRIGDLAIEIEAGLAFGTGHHGTTAGCLQAIADLLKREKPRNALDLGTGSAVLAIALARAARIPVLATDIDPIATQVAAENARLNGVGALVETHTAPGFHNRIFAERKPFDLIVANILARPLMRLAPQMANHLTPGGALILSGILERQRDAVVASYVNQGFRHFRTQAREGWVTIVLRR